MEYWDGAVDGSIASIASVTSDPTLGPEFLDVVMELAAVAVLMVNADGVISAANPMAHQLFGAPPRGLPGFSVEDLLDPELGRAHRRHRVSFSLEGGHRAMADGRVLPAQRLDGSPLHVRVGLHALGDGRTICVLLDRTQEVLARSEVEVRAARAAELVGTLDSLKTARERLLTAASHELRTPLTVVLGGARTLQSKGDELPEELRRDLLDRVVTNASRLHSLLDDLAMASAAARIDVDFSTLDLLGQLRRFAMRQRAERHVAIEVRTIHDEVLVHANAATVERAIELLVDNGLRHGLGTVTLRVWTRGQRACIDVLDEGPGIPPSYLDRALQPLGRATEFDTVQPGLGIGLPLARVLVQANGGEFRPVERGAGVFITLELPVA